MNQQNLLRQAQKLQQEMMRAQEELKEEVVEGSAGGGAVKVKVSGDLQIKAVVIDPEVVDPEEVELLQDMVSAAVSEGITAAQKLANSKLGALTGGLGGLGFPGM